jgi:monoterpene epsilon-lactone hydrolase
MPKLRDLTIGAVLMALPLASGAAAPQSQFENPVPTTISPEAQAFMRGLKDPSTYPAMPEATDLEGWRRAQAAQEERSKPAMDAIRRQYAPTITNGHYGGVPVLDIQPQGYKKDFRVIVFVHGGGYVMNSAASSLDGSVPLANDTGIRVVSVDYTLAPFATYGVMLDQVIAVVDALLEDGLKPRNIAIVGVSAGGGLVAGSALKMRDQGRKPVAALILWSPAADLTMQGETVTTLRRYEPAFDVSKMSGLLDTVVPADERKNPYVSPAFGSFSKGYPPTLIQGGTREVLLSGFVQLYQAIDSQGGTVKLDVYEGMVHTFQEIRPDLPESKLARRKDADFLRHYLEP